MTSWATPPLYPHKLAKYLFNSQISSFPNFASVAQLVEQRILNPRVKGSSPFGGTKREGSVAPGSWALCILGPFKLLQALPV